VAIKDDKYTLSTTPELIAAGGGGANKRTVLIKGASATIYLGGPTVSVADGFPMTTTDVFSLELGSGDDLYAVAAAATPTVNVLITNSNARVSTGD